MELYLHSMKALRQIMEMSLRMMKIWQSRMIAPYAGITTTLSAAVSDPTSELSQLPIFPILTLILAIT